LTPGASASAAFVGRIWAFGDQSLEAERLRDPEKFIFGAAEFVRKPDIFRGVLEKVDQQFALKQIAETRRRKYSADRGALLREGELQS